MPRLTAASSAKRREEILDGALRCFATTGFHAATMADIATASDMSAANLYRHFRSKELIVEAIAEARHRRERELIDAAFEHDRAPAALHRLCEAYVAWLKDPAERLRRRVGVGLWAHGLHDARTGQAMARGMAQHRHLAARLEAAKQNGELRGDLDAVGLARLLLAIFQGTILQQSYEPRLELDAIATQVHQLLDGLLGVGPQTRR